MTDYLDEAADQLRKARDANEKRAYWVAETYGDLPQYATTRTIAMAEIGQRRMEIAAAFTRLAECQAAMLDAARMPDFLAAGRTAAPADPQARSQP